MPLISWFCLGGPGRAAEDSGNWLHNSRIHSNECANSCQQFGSCVAVPDIPNRSLLMPKRDPDLLVEDMLEALRKFELFTSGMDHSSFL
jgi:hypothetical protein